ncbi:MAG TPA: hypothetical protein VD887_12420 [Allosphingosinicella sp.]|nr:hypothetical protein [Allosphingosinicella sp.]
MGPLLLVAAAFPAGGVAAQTPTPAPAAPPPMCTSAEHRAFDFWVGRWDVYRADTNALVAHSLIERMYDGCAIRENWMPHGRAGGGSLSTWDPAARRWCQTWVDSANTYAVFEGGFSGGQMVLTGRWLGYSGPGTDVPARMTYSVQPSGAVLQRVDISNDAGETWTLGAALLYRRAEAAPPPVR